jgi:hypothetical protein
MKNNLYLFIYVKSLPPLRNRSKNYYKVWVKFINPCSLNEWNHSKSREITWRTRRPFVVMVFPNLLNLIIYVCVCVCVCVHDDFCPIVYKR